MSITSNAFTRLALVALATSGLLACAGEGSEEPTTEQSSTEPTLFSGDSTQPADDSQRGTDDLGDLGRAAGATARTISFNHPEPHSLVIPATDLLRAKGGSYTLSAGGGAFGETHTHDVDLTPEQLGEILDGAFITVESSPAGARGGHTHFVTIARR